MNNRIIPKLSFRSLTATSFASIQRAIGAKLLSARVPISHTPSSTSRLYHGHPANLLQSALLVIAAAFLFSLPVAKAGSGTINGLMADAEAHSDGTVANVYNGIGIIGGTSGIQSATVSVFPIPADILADPNLQFSDVKYTIKTNYPGLPTFNCDLYGIGYSTTSSAVVASDYYEGTLDTSNYLIKDNFLTPSTPAYTAISASNSTLVNYMNTQLDAVRNAGASSAYVFLRINPDAYSPGNFYRIGMADSPYADYKPHLDYTTASGPLWRSVAIGGGAYVTGLISSTSGDAIYARTDVGGAYHWDSTNVKWIPITDSLPNENNFGIGSLAVDPQDSKRVFISSGKWNYVSPSGIYMTSDATLTSPTWNCIDSTIRVYGNGARRFAGEHLQVDPYNSNVVYYGTENIAGYGSGLTKYYYDTAWHSGTMAFPAVGDPNWGISFVALDSTGGSVSDGTRTVCKYMYVGVYSGTAGAGGVYASSDGGSNWTKVTNVAVDKPNQGRVAKDGTLYVTFDGTFASNGGVVKLARGATAFTSIAPVASTNYCGVAVDPTSANTVMVSELVGSTRMWRSIDSGTSWVLMNRTINATEPDGTPSATLNGSFIYLTGLMINPAQPREVWACDMGGVQCTPSIQDTTTAAPWYLLQKNHEEICVLELRCAPSGSRLLSALADANGFVHNNPSVRPTPADRFENPIYIASTSVNYSAATSGSSTVWARVGDIYNYTNSDSDRAGAVSLNDGQSWVAFGQLDAKGVTNGNAASWETFDVGPYLKQQKEAGATTVTLCVRATSQSNQYSLHFSSKEGANPPQLIVSGTATLTPTADAYVWQSGTSNNYGSDLELRAQNYFEGASYNRRSFIKFDLTNVSSISSATLKLYRLAASDTTAFDASVYASATTDWTESTLTWANKPTLYAPPSGSTVHGGHIALSSSDPRKIVWVADNGKVYYSTNRGVTWPQATLSGSNMLVDTTAEFQPNRSQLSVDRVLADTFYIFANTGSGTIYRSTDGGATWAVMVTGIGYVYPTNPTSGFRIESVPGMSGKLWYCAGYGNTLASYFKYWNGTAMVTVPGISSVIDFAFGKAADGRTNPTAYIRKLDGTYWYSVDATAGTSFTWTQMAVPSINDAAWVMAGDFQKYGRLYVGTNGRGIFFTDMK